MDLETIVVVLGALGGLTGLAALINSFSNARSSSVENLQNLVNVLNEEIVRLRTRIAVLEDTSADQAEKIRTLENKVAHWRDKYYELCDWVREGLGLEPFEDIEE